MNGDGNAATMISVLDSYRLVRIDGDRISVEPRLASNIDESEMSTGTSVCSVGNQKIANLTFRSVPNKPMQSELDFLFYGVSLIGERLYVFPFFSKTITCFYHLILGR